MSKGVCPNCRQPHSGLVTTAPMGPDGAGVTHCGCFWEGDAEGKDFHHSTTTAEQHAWMRGERNEDNVSEQSKAPAKGYVVRGTNASGTVGYAVGRDGTLSIAVANYQGAKTVYALLDIADSAAVDLLREGCEDVRVHRVDADGHEEPLPTWAELAAHARGGR